MQVGKKAGPSGLHQFWVHAQEDKLCPQSECLAKKKKKSYSPSYAYVLCKIDHPQTTHISKQNLFLYILFYVLLLLLTNQTMVF